MKTTLLLVLSGMVLLATGARAHHSFSSEFDINQPIKLTGVLTKVDWVNPHGWIYIDVKQPDGKIVNWAIEAGGATAMLRRGLRKTDFPAGIALTVEGFRAKTGEPKANGRSVTMNDGRNFFLGPDAGQAGAPQ
jgi:hypothetical protein